MSKMRYSKNDMGTITSFPKTKEHATVGIRESFELTVPPQVGKRLTLGEFFRVEQVGSALVLRPVDVIDPSQAWFWTAIWQGKEHEADEDIKAGHISGPFRTSKEFMHGLKR